MRYLVGTLVALLRLSGLRERETPNSHNSLTVETAEVRLEAGLKDEALTNMFLRAMELK
jgi:hypothetical protein